MPTLIIQVYDGRVTIAAPAEVPPELMQDAQEVASIEEAAQVVQDVLGQDAGAMGGEGQPGAGEGAATVGDGDPDVGGGETAGMAAAPADEDAAMDQGFTKARKGR